MKGHVETRVERYCEVAKKVASFLQQVEIPCMDDAWERKLEGTLNCGRRTLLRCRSACDNRLLRLMNDINQNQHTKGHSLMWGSELERAGLVCSRRRHPQVICETQSPHLNDDWIARVASNFMDVQEAIFGCLTAVPRLQLCRLMQLLRMDGLPALKS